MPPVVIDIRSADDVRDVVHRAVQALVEGKLVALPTETVYGLAVSALDESAVRRLVDAKGRDVGHPLTLAVKSADDALDYVPDFSPVAQRLARRCWPGPLTLVLTDNHPDSLLQQLPEAVRQTIVPNDTVGLRVPAHPLTLDVLRLVIGPLALTSANRSGDPEALTAEDVVQSLGDDVALVLDDGRCKFGQPSSVVQVADNGLKILRTGVVSDTALKRLSSFQLLIVCTGNTCRSPMGELMLRQQVADKLGHSMDELDEYGVTVSSAGIAALAGGRPSPEAVRVMHERGLDLSQHASQPLTKRLVHDADMIFTMTRSHREAVVAQWPHAAPRTWLLSPNGIDIIDPIGGSVDIYRECADRIDLGLDARLSDFDWDSLVTKVQ